MKLDILMLTRWFVSWNGASRAVYHIAQALTRLGHRARILTYSGYIDKSWQRICEVYPIRAHTHNWLSLFRISKLIHKLDPDVIHSHGLLGFASWLAKRSYISTYHGTGTLGMTTSSRIFVATMYFYVPSILDLRLAKVVTTVSKYMGSIIKNFYGVKSVHIIPNGIESNFLLRKLDYSKRRYITFMGSITEWKAKYLVEIIRRFHERYHNKVDNYQFVVIGPIRNLRIYQQLKKLEKLNTWVYGYASDEEKLKLLDLSRVFILPSQVENLPISILEAYARGVPAIAFKVGGIPEIVKHNTTGYLVKPFDVNSFVHYIYNIMIDDKLYRTLSSNCLTFAKNYTWDSIVKKYLNLYLHILST